jgi:aspartate racemase
MKVIGILGGMGPQATIDLYQKILDSTAARKDQEHIPTLIWSNPGIPDRNLAILHGGPDPSSALREGAIILEAGGADFIVVPCNTAHLFADAIREAVKIPLLNMVEETAARAADRLPPGSPVSILATTATVATGLYQKALEKHGLSFMLPDSGDQEIIMAAIFDERGIKAGFVDDHNRTRVLAVVRRQQELGAVAFIAGCTELPLVIRPDDAECMLDPTLLLAQAAVRLAGAKPRM